MGFIHPTAEIHPSSVIYPNVTIGPNVKIGPLCIIGAPAEWKGHEHEDGGVYIGENVVITGLVTIDSGTKGRTVVEAGSYIMKHAHIGHDAYISVGVTIACGAKIGGHTLIGDYTNIGLNAVIHQKLNIPHSCMIGMGSVVTKKTEMEPECKYVGNPARYLSPNIK
jgi:UDP-N-acetylglucosamine acyltransferase